MKKRNVIIVLVLTVLMSFTTVINQSYSAKVNESTVEWKGFKPAGEHFGTISISEGSLIANGNTIITGSFTIDMNTIVDKDMAPDNEYSAKLVNHLKSSDFFDVKKFPTAKFDISGTKKVKGKNHIVGYLTIKGIRKEISFPAKVSKNEMGDLVLESETFKINRADFNIKYKSKTFYANLKDKFIYDEFEMKVKIVAASK